MAPPLTPSEAAAMRADPKVGERLLRSFRLVLDSFGMRLIDDGPAGFGAQFKRTSYWSVCAWLRPSCMPTVRPAHGRPLSGVPQAAV